MRKQEFAGFSWHGAQCVPGQIGQTKVFRMSSGDGASTVEIKRACNNASRQHTPAPIRDMLMERLALRARPMRAQLVL